MLTIRYEHTFKKDYRRCIKRGCDPRRLEFAVQTIASGLPLPPQFRDHALVGQYHDCRECHLSPDWLLIYKINHDELILVLARTGSHSDLF